MKKCLLLFVLLSFLLCQTAMADFYKWVDEKGETQITDFPPPQDRVAKDVEIHKSPTIDLTNKENADDSAKKKINVVLYTKNDCADCDKAREYLKSKNIAFTEYNMDYDKEAAAKRKEVDDGDDVPFAVINKSRIFGFKESVYDKALKVEP
jgi:glutaredoxin